VDTTAWGKEWYTLSQLNIGTVKETVYKSYLIKCCREIYLALRFTTHKKGVKSIRAILLGKPEQRQH
jgi:hypothetical protein